MVYAFLTQCIPKNRILKHISTGDHAAFLSSDQLLAETSKVLATVFKECSSRL